MQIIKTVDKNEPVFAVVVTAQWDIISSVFSFSKRFFSAVVYNTHIKEGGVGGWKSGLP